MSDYFNQKINTKLEEEAEQNREQLANGKLSN
jgi:hypothetical protein